MIGDCPDCPRYRARNYQRCPGCGADIADGLYRRPLPDIRPNGPLDNRPSFKPARKQERWS